MLEGKRLKHHPSLTELLERRGITKNKDFGDYQDYIERKETEGLLPRVLNLVRVPVEGSMHLATGKVQQVRNFWTTGDKS